MRSPSRLTVAGRVLLLLATLGAAGVSAFQQTSEPRSDLFIAGRVLDVDAVTPLANVVVAAAGGARGGGRGALTDVSGRYRIDGLAPGRVTLQVRRPGYLDDSAQVVLVEDRSLDGLDLYLERTAAISGTVVDEHTEPVANMTVMAVDPNELIPGRSAGRRVGEYAVTTDERGVYELIVPAGEYVVGVPAVRGVAAAGALEALGARGWREGMPAPAGLRVPMAAATGQGLPWEGLPTRPVTAPGERPLTYPDTYFPGTPLAGQATLLRVESGARRDGIDIALTPSPALTLAGVVAPMPPPPEGVHVALRALGPALNPTSRELNADAQGGFAFELVPPGRYEVEAFPRRTNVATGATYIRLAHEFGIMAVELSDRDVEDLPVTLAPGPTVTARITVQGARTPGERTLSLRRVSPGESRHRSSVTEDGLLLAEGVRPGTYEFSATSGWTIESATRPGQDLLAVPLEVGAGDIDDIDLVVTYRRLVTDGGGLAGTIGGLPAGPPVATALLVVVDPDAPSSISGRDDIRNWVAPWTSDGTYDLIRIPPGDYWLVAVTPLEAARWRDPATLARLTSRAVRVTLGQDEMRRVDLAGPSR